MSRGRAASAWSGCRPRTCDGSWKASRLDLPTATRAAAHARMATRLAGRPDAAELATEIAHHWLSSLPVAAEAARAAGDPHALGAVALTMEGLSDPWGDFRGDRLG